MTSRSSPPFSDRLLAVALRVSAGLAGGIVLLICAFLVSGAWPALRDVGFAAFVTDGHWRPTEAEPQYGLGALIVGTLAATLGAVALAAPLGVFVALFARFYAPPSLGRWTMRLVALFAGVPSVVFGLWGLTTLAPLVRQIEPPGTSLCTAILVLALMILPTVALLSSTAFDSVRDENLRGAAALSLSRVATLRGVVWPASRAGIGVAVLLAATRALGETMAVVMVAGNVARVPKSLFAPVRTLTANIALELGYATAGHRAALFASGVCLLLLVTALVLVARRVTPGESRA